MDVMDAILARRSCRAYTDQPVSDAEIEALLKAAQAAPSGGNGQNHVFGVVRDEARRRALAEAAGKQTWIAGAPVVLACCARLDLEYPSLPADDFGLRVDKLRFGEAFIDHLLKAPDWRGSALLIADGAPLIPCENIALAATQMGLSTCVVGYLDVNRAGEILNLPRDVACLYLMPIGHAAKAVKPVARKPLEEISFSEVWPG